MIKEILKESDATTKELLSVLSSFTQEQFDVIPFEGSWTVGQIAEHLAKSATVVLKALNGTVKNTERHPWEKVDTVKNIFLDFEQKLKNPDFNQPVENVHDKEEMLNRLKDLKEEMSEVIITKELSDTCTSFVLPGIKEMTRLEWIYLDNYHTQRHIHQLKNIRKQLEENVKLQLKTQK